MGTRQINVVVSDEQKTRWDQYADDIGESLSHIIRSSVEREIATDGERTGEIPDDVTERLAEIQQQNERLANLVEGNERRLVTIESAVQEPGADIQDVANQILDVLPESRGPPTDDEIEAWTDATEPGETDTPPTTIQELAEALDETEGRVAEAIDLLESSTGMVRSSERGDETHYGRVS
jgi:hypothetical protein